MELTIKQLQSEIESLTITSNEELENANKLAKKCNELIKGVKASHKDEIAKYHKLHKEAKANEKEELDPLEKCKGIIKNAIGSYMKVLEQQRLEVQKQQEEEQEIFGEVMTQQEEVNLGGTHVRKSWKARIVDESQVPIKYGNHIIRTIDMSKLNDIAKYEEGKAVIPGVEFYEDETVVVR